MGKGLKAWTQEEPEVAGKRIWNLLGSQAPLPSIFSMPEPHTATPFVAWELSVLVSRRPGSGGGASSSVQLPRGSYKKRPPERGRNMGTGAWVTCEVYG